jgi:DNA repair protein RadD
MKLRPYQQEVVDTLWQWFSTHEQGDPIVEAAVGAGKSLMIAEVCRRAIEEFPGTRLLMVVHVKELCAQNLDKLLRIWPEAPAGVHSASIGRKDLGHDILYATIGSVYKKAHMLGRVDLMIVDECHLISNDDQTMYRKLIDDLRFYNPGMRVIGWTGTPFRGDGIWLTHGALFTHIAARVPMRQLLDEGYLSPLVVNETAPTLIDASQARVVAGDYVVRDIVKVATQPTIVERACSEIVRLAAQRKKWLVFCATIEHAELVAERMFANHDVECEVLTNKTPKRERERIVEEFRHGSLRCLVNVAVLTTGFDAPETDCIALLRPTKSPVLYVQIAGRGMRLADGKKDCLWLDFTTTTVDLGPVDKAKGRNPTPPGNAPFKYCEGCGIKLGTATIECPECGHIHPAPAEPVRGQHGDLASRAPVISTDPNDAQYAGPKWETVTRVVYSLHEGKNGKPDSMRVDYLSGWRTVGSEWVCFDHPEGSYPHKKAVQWWRERDVAMKEVFPANVEMALKWSEWLAEPYQIATIFDGKFVKVVGHKFNLQKDKVAA